MRQYPTNRIVWGTYKRECDRCGFDFLRTEMVKDRYGFVVCPKCYDSELAWGESTHTVPVDKPFKRD